MTGPTIAVFGSGRMADVRAAALRRADPEVRLLFRSRSADAAAAVAARHDGSPVAPGSAWPPVDASLVTSATEHHGTDTLEAVALGAPVLCEKPLATNVGDARGMAEHAAAQGVALFVAFQRRFDPGHTALREQVATGSAGTTYQVRATSFDAEPATAEFIAGSGGIFRDLLVHDIDSVSWVTGTSVARVLATASVRAFPRYAEAGDADVATVLLWMSDGLVVTLQGARHDPFGQDVRLELLGSGGSFSVGLDERTPLRALDGPQLFSGSRHESFQQRWSAAYERETAAFLAHVRDGVPFEGATADEALRVQAVAEACVQSASSGTVVEVGGP